MNKAQLVDALTARLGDRRAATAAVDAMVDVIVDTVGAGESVTLTGFGVFEARRRAPRTARNPRTGATVPVEETVVPSFRPGAAFKERVAGSDAAAAGATSAPKRAPRERPAASPTRTARRSRAATGEDAAKGARSTTAKGTSAGKGATAKGATAKGAAGKDGARRSATNKEIPPDTSAPGAGEKKPARRRTPATG